MNENTTDDIQSVQGTTPDLQTEFAKKLSELAPELLADGKIDSKKLKELLDGDEADDSERFGLFWPGKKRAMRAAQEPTTATLKPAKNESKDWDTTQNLFIEGDNLEVLKVLQKHYHNKIKMIYIDPPYNTGKDFVYPDNYKEGLASYLEFTNQTSEDGRRVSTNNDTDGRYHSNWLNMMYPRLKLARNLLTDDGIFLVSIDDHEQDNLRKLCNEVFGESNFCGQIIWKNSSKNDQDYISEQHEYFIAYVKNKAHNKGEWIERKEGLQEIYKQFDTLHRLHGSDWKKIHSEALKWYKSFNESNPIYSSKHYSWMDERGVYFPADISGPNFGQYRYDVIHPVTGKICKEPASGWRYPESTMKQRIADNLVHFGNDENTIPNNKVYLKDTEVQSLTSIKYKDGRVASNALKQLMGGDYFTNPKNVDLLALFFAAFGVEKDDIVLDFFSGSGTTAHTVMQMNAVDGGSRRHIQVQLPEPTYTFKSDKKVPRKDAREAFDAGYMTISDIAKDRLRLAGDKILSDYTDNVKDRPEPLDIGFKIYTLTDSNFTKWQSQSDTDKDSLQQRLLDIRESSNNAATEEDLLTEVLLKQGISLTAPISHADVAGLSVWTVGDNLVCAYLNEKQKPNLDQLRAIAANEPAKLIVLEDAFQGDDELKTNLHQICKSQKIELWTV